MLKYIFIVRLFKLNTTLLEAKNKVLFNYWNIARIY